MKTLYESILSDIDTSLEAGTADADYLAVMEVINKDYKLYKTYKSNIIIVGKAESGKVLINGTGKIEFINKSAKSIVNDVFEWNEIDGEFICFKKNIESLEGFPRKIYSKDLSKGGININQCRNLKTIKGAPNVVFGPFYCTECDSLISLEGAPEKMCGNFYCMRCDSLKSLKGAPKYLSGNFNCADCRNLESIEGLPDKIYGSFDCGYCKSLKSLKGLPSLIEGNLTLPKVDSLFDEIGEEIINKTRVKGKAYVM